MWLNRDGNLKQIIMSCQRYAEKHCGYVPYSMGVNDIGAMDYFAYCFFQMLSGDSRRMNAFPKILPAK